jgi:hypothetical protein
MNPDILKEYPQISRLLDEQDRMGFPPNFREIQENAIELIANYGGGTTAEKEASMICAAMICDPSQLYFAPLTLFDCGYSEEVETVLQQMMSTQRGEFMPAMLAQATAASGIALLEDVVMRLKSGSMEASPRETLEQLRQSCIQDRDLFAYMDAPVLLTRYERARDQAFAALEENIDPATPKRPFKPGGQSFDF